MKKVFSVFDKKAAVYCNPFVSHSRQVAMRDLEAAVMDPNSQLNKFSSDYELYELGSWNEDTGGMELYPSPEFVVNAGSFTFELEVSK